MARKSKREKLIDKENLTIEHIINTNSIDRYSSIVLPKGVDTKSYSKNNVVLYLHNHTERQIPIGVCSKLIKSDDSIRAITQFNKNDDFAVNVFNAYADGFMNAWSIGFKPKDYVFVDKSNREEINTTYGLSVTEKDIDKAEKTSWYGLVLVKEWELLEYSAVPVPGNQDCVTEDFMSEIESRGLNSIDESFSFGIRNADFGAACYTEDTEEPKVELEIVEEKSNEDIDTNLEEGEAMKKAKLEVVEEKSTGEVVEQPVVEVAEELSTEVETETTEVVEEDAIVEDEVVVEEEVKDEEEIVEEETVVEEEVKVVKEGAVKEEVVEEEKDFSKLITDLTALVTSLKEEVDEMKRGMEAGNLENIRKVSANKDTKTQGRTGWASRALKGRTA